MCECECVLESIEWLDDVRGWWVGERWGFSWKLEILWKLCFSFSFFFSSQEWSPSHLEWDLELSDVVTVGILRRFGGLTWPFSSFFFFFSSLF